MISEQLPTLDEILSKKMYIEDQKNSLSYITLISEKDPEKETIKKMLNDISQINNKESRALACFICAAIGDALGCHTEFYPFKYMKKNEKFIIQSFENLKQFNNKRAAIGHWTDDNSMALCLADSLLRKNGVFDGVDIRYRFLLWWHFGYNNGRKGERSFGLGGNISDSFEDFYKNKDQNFMTVNERNKNNSGNGSLMRLAGVPIYFHDKIDLGEEYAYKQSKTTHPGMEAAYCCKLLTHLIIRLINREDDKNFKEIFDKLPETFNPDNDCPLSVKKLAASEREKNEIKSNIAASDDDRDWNWKNIDYNFSPTRSKKYSDYFGSYCMDALALSMNYAYHSSNAKEAVLRAVNAGGDSDTVAAITGQIVGSIYGLQKEIIELYFEGIIKWDDYAIATAAYRLFHHKHLQ